MDTSSLLRVGRYDIEQLIARGGTAAIWQGWLWSEGGVGRNVVVKTLLPHLTNDPKVRAMFFEEARIAAEVIHPNVRAALDVGEEGGVAYSVFELVEGCSLTDLIRAAEANGESLPLTVLLRVLTEICHGLHAAHEQCDVDGSPRHIVHRDVSPANILVSRHGGAKVIDFGIAQTGSVADSGKRPVSGRIRFMSPEQARGEHVDRRADVWAVGAVLYRLLAGRSHYNVPGDPEFLGALRRGALPLPMSRKIPASLARIVMRALSVNPAMRQPTARALATDLRHVASSLGLECGVDVVANYVDGLSSSPPVSTRRMSISRLPPRMSA